MRGKLGELGQGKEEKNWDVGGERNVGGVRGTLGGVRGTLGGG